MHDFQASRCRKAFFGSSKDQTAGASENASHGPRDLVLGKSAPMVHCPPFAAHLIYTSHLHASKANLGSMIYVFLPYWPGMHACPTCLYPAQPPLSMSLCAVHSLPSACSAMGTSSSEQAG